MTELPAPASRRIDRRADRPTHDRIGSLLVLVAVWAAGCAVLAAVVLQRAVPARDLLVDPVTVRGSAWYAGFVTSLGVLAWGVAACACTATAYAASLAGRPAAVRAFRGAALLFGLLLFDDLFLLHSGLIPELLDTTKATVLAGLGVLAGLWALPSLPELRRTRWELFAASSAAFAASLVVELLVPGQEAGLRVLAEDGPKLLGVLALAAWATMTARDVIRSIVGDPVPAGTDEPVDAGWSRATAAVDR